MDINAGRWAEATALLYARVGGNPGEVERAIGEFSRRCLGDYMITALKSHAYLTLLAHIRNGDLDQISREFTR